MSPESWTTPEMVRAISDIKRTLGEIRAELRDQRGEYLSREVYTSDRTGDQKSLADYKQQVAIDIVNLEAEQARVRKDIRAEVNEIRAGQRWAFGVAVTAIIGAISSVVAVINMVGLGA